MLNGSRKIRWFNLRIRKSGTSCKALSVSTVNFVCIPRLTQLVYITDFAVLEAM